MRAFPSKPKPPSTSNTPSKKVLWRDLEDEWLYFKIWQGIEAKVEEFSFSFLSRVAGQEVRNKEEFWSKFNLVKV